METNIGDYIGTTTLSNSNPINLKPRALSRTPKPQKLPASGLKRSRGVEL